jgi:hypothetical protein
MAASNDAEAVVLRSALEQAGHKVLSTNQTRV